MAEIINLKRVRKRLQRQDEAEAAAANRARFGRTAVQRTLDAAAPTQLRNGLDGAKLTDDPTPPDPD